MTFGAHTLPQGKLTSEYSRLSGLPANLLTMEPGVYESLLTARLQQALNASTDQVSDLKDIDEAEQPPGAVARHLARLIEQALKAARTWARISMNDILSAPCLTQRCSKKLCTPKDPIASKRLRCRHAGGDRDSSRYVRRVTPLGRCFDIPVTSPRSPPNCGLNWPAPIASTCFWPSLNGRGCSGRHRGL